MQRATPGESPATSEVTPPRQHQYSPSSRTHPRHRGDGNSSRHSSTNSPKIWQRSAYESAQGWIIPPSSFAEYQPRTASFGPEVPLEAVQSSCINAELIFRGSLIQDRFTLALPGPATWAFTDDIPRRESPTTATGAFASGQSRLPAHRPRCRCLMTRQRNQGRPRLWRTIR